MNLETRIRSTGARLLSSRGFQRLSRNRARLKRRLGGGQPEIHYFHQVDDPYSHLAVQKLDQLRATYPLAFKVLLCSQPSADYLGSSEHFDNWALRDAASIASGYGLDFPANPVPPQPDAVRAANDQLAPLLESDSFAGTAKEIGASLWTGASSEQLQAVGSKSAEGRTAVATGNAAREKLGHYAGAMFYFEGEWYWGVDRLRLLEARLAEESLAPARTQICVPEPTPVDTTSLDTGAVLLEYFPSLRSPYTAIGHNRVLELIERSGVNVAVRPVMPMLMRGVPAPRAKQRYIISDAAREGHAHGSPLGRIVDPFGDPVRRAFALFPAAEKLSKGMEFVTAYLQAAWVDGVDITTEAGLKVVAEQAGLDWQALQDAREGTDWEAVLDQNLNEMLSAGLWGVPSFRVSGGNASEAFACWGQDRIWRVENEIAARVTG
ncbi:MAG: 2-hydroxychromene-2-carboxylate isomerase [Gammaproteobacteria bacterium]|nr:MAG: 2-hydroxychromene-2-carboxylate isomerase [Gammaproteobacteria bacterium]